MNKEPTIISIAPDVVCDLRSLHSRITDNDNAIELHSADVAALCASMQALAKRLNVIEEAFALHCSVEVKDMHCVAAESGEEGHASEEGMA